MNPPLIREGPCIGCGTPLKYDPNLVPALRIQDELEPLCKECVDKINQGRAKWGKEPHIIPDGAYFTGEKKDG